MVTVARNGFRGEGCGGMSIDELDDGRLRLVYCEADWCGSVTAFHHCAAVFQATATADSLSGLMATHTGGCCRGCPGQNRGWEAGCTIMASLATGTDGRPHLTGSFDSACPPAVRDPFSPSSTSCPPAALRAAATAC